MPLLIHAMAGPFTVHSEPVLLAGETHGEIGHVDHLLDFALAFGADLAHLHRDERAEIGFAAAEFVGEFAHYFAALGGGDDAPFKKGFGGAGDRKSTRL